MFAGSRVVGMFAHPQTSTLNFESFLRMASVFSISCPIEEKAKRAFKLYGVYLSYSRLRY